MPMSFRRGMTTPLGAQTPFRRTIEPSALGVFVNLEQRDMERLRRYEQNWRMYLGQQWNFTREDGEPLVTVNKLMPVINKGVTWLLGNGFSLGVQRSPDGEERALPQKLLAPIAPHLRQTWDQLNERQVLLLELGLMGAITGDVWLLVTPEPVTDAARAANPDIEMFLRIHVLGSESVFPIWDPANTERMLGVKIVTLFVDDSHGASGTDVVHQRGPINTRRFTQVITPDLFIEQMEGQEPIRRQNPLGEIPIVHIKNMGVPREYYGLSDMDAGLVDLQRELNEKVTDISDTVNYHSQPITVIVGAKVKNLERGPKKVWSGFPQGTNVFNLEMKTDLNAAVKYVEKVENWILEGADLPETALGKIPPISNTSGVALNLQNRPIIDRIKRKRPYYERGIRDINYFILRWKQELEGLRLPQGFCKQCGGRIMEVAVKNPDGSVAVDRRGRAITRPKCYHADPWTGQFTRPEDMKVRFVQQFSFGSEIQEMERWKMVARYLNRRSSFWDPLGDLLREVSDTRRQEARDNAVTQATAAGEQVTAEATGTVATPPVPSADPTEVTARVTSQTQAEREAAEDEQLRGRAVLPQMQDELEAALDMLMQGTRLPEGALQVPAEPERAIVVIELFDEETGQPLTNPDGTRRTEERELFVVPTECVMPERFNPLSVPCTLNDALPMDKHSDAQLAVQLATARIWSRRKAMEHMRVADPEQMLREVEADNPPAAGQPSIAGGVRGEDIPRTMMQGQEQARATANQGNANQPLPPGAGPQFGRNQGES